MPRGRKPPRRYARGALDLTATAMLLRDPTLTRAEIARRLGCNPKSLMNRAKYPLLARELARIRAARWDYRPPGGRPDRRWNGATMPDLDDEVG